MPLSAPPSSSSPTSPVRYFDLLPNELVRLIVEHVGPVRYKSIYAYTSRQADLRALCLVSRRLRSIAQPLLSQVVHLLSKDRGRTTWNNLTVDKKQRMLVLVVHDPFEGDSDGIRSKGDPVGFFDGTPDLTHLAVQYGQPLLWMSQGTLQHLRFLRVGLNLHLPPGPLWAPLLPSLEALSILGSLWFSQPHVLDEGEWTHLFPSLRVLDFHATRCRDSALIEQLELVQYSFWTFDSNSGPELGELRPHGSKVLPIVSVHGADPDDTFGLAQLMMTWDGLPMAIHYEASDGIEEFVRDLVQALEDLQPLPETFRTLYLPSSARLSLADASSGRDASVDGLTLEGVEIVLKIVATKTWAIQARGPESSANASKEGG
ncbi:hypothetical protein JCM10212_005856 [Sporobolomyces blumeae]